MKKCELCKKAARMYCHSDEASLCWDCDSRVHTANFLVSKHTRTLLCHACQSPTPWTGSGPKLGPTVSVCEACFIATNRNTDGDRNPEEDDDGENQVVPLSLPPSSSERNGLSSSTHSSSNATSTSQTSRFAYNRIQRNTTQTSRSRRWP